ncbi:MAG: hypothetical protein NTX82_03835 [Candidatus Parcubacteria bacterium]|nr:hypothetical protein [Candidatus Parcubacteria bacterium]
METIFSIFRHIFSILFFSTAAVFIVGSFMVFIQGVTAFKSNEKRDMTLVIFGFGIAMLIIGCFIFYLAADVSGHMPKIKEKYVAVSLNMKHSYKHIFHHWNKEVVLENKIEELNNLQQKLAAKQLEIQNLQSEYSNEIEGLVDEIRELQQSGNFRTFSQAKEHPGIFYNLSLIQRKQAYIAKLQETSVRLKYGIYELKYLERAACDDLKMVKTLDNEVVETLIKNINTVIDKYLPDAGKLAIEVDPNSMQTPEQIWQQINSGN